MIVCFLGGAAGCSCPPEAAGAAQKIAAANTENDNSECLILNPPWESAANQVSGYRAFRAYGRCRGSLQGEMLLTACLKHSRNCYNYWNLHKHRVRAKPMRPNLAPSIH